MNLILDIGNSQTVFAFYQDDYKFCGQFRLDSDINYKPEYLCRILTRKMQEFSLENISVCIIASVVPRLTAHYKNCLKELLELDAFIITHESYSDLKHNYYDLSQLGIDRLCNIAAAKQKWNNSIIVIDFGTAITFEVIDSAGSFSGGLILPGIRLSSESLTKKTALLPKVDLSFPKNVIGRSTEECIQSGIMYGTAELCRGMINKVKQELGLSEMMIVSTGGYAQIFADIITEISYVELGLVPQGALAIYQNSQK